MDPTQVGDYQISVIGGTPILWQDPVYSEELIINLEVAN